MEDCLWAQALPLIIAFQFLFPRHGAELKSAIRKQTAIFDPYIYMAHGRFIPCSRKIQRMDHWNHYCCIVYRDPYGTETPAEDLEKAGYAGRISRACLKRKSARQGQWFSPQQDFNRNHILWFLPYEMERGESTAESAYERDKTHLVSIGFPEDILDD